MTERVSRAERFVQITVLRRDGLTIRQVGLRLGISRSMVSEIINDPDGSKARARRESYAGVCDECGGPTDGSNGRANAPPRCLYCIQGIPMRDRERPADPSLRRCVPVRLCDLPLEVRLEGVRIANRREQGDVERVEILLAAVEPSDRVYWVAKSALARVEELMADAA